VIYRCSISAGSKVVICGTQNRKNARPNKTELEWKGETMGLKFGLDDLATPGGHDARIIAVEDLGRIQWKYGKEHAVKITFEITDQKDANGDFAIVTMKYSLKMSANSTFGQLLDGMGYRRDGKDFNLDCLLNETLRVNIQHNRDGKFANVTHVIPESGYVRPVRFAAQCDFYVHGQQCPELTYERFCSKHGGAA
jgi:hypothetical protein